MTALSFVHIPKTGGSSLRWILDRQYRPFLYLIPQWFHGIAAGPGRAAAGQRRPPQAVGAHLPYRRDQWPAGPAIALVRDPVRRVLSHVAHLRAEPRAWLPEPVPELALPLAEWIEKRPLALFDNDQVRYLSGAAEFDGMALTSTMGDRDLELALAAVRGEVLAAPVEAFDEALLDWTHRLGWRPPYYRRVNVRRRPKDVLADRDRSALEAWNRLDHALCEEVGVLFRQRLAQLERESGVVLGDAVADFRRRNQSAPVQARLLAHTVRRGLRHPLRAAHMLVRTTRQRVGRSSSAA